MDTTRISKALMRRLPVYLNYLKSLPGEDCNISATTIANALGLGDVQVRKDLAKISPEGRRRTGRSRNQLIRDIEEHLDCSSTTTSIVVGAGALGQALLDYSGFENSGVRILACFDSAPSAKKTESGKPIYSLSWLPDFCRCYNVQIGIIAVPAENAQAVCDRLVACGINAIWNFAPTTLKVPDGVLLHNENLAVSLTALRLQMWAKEEETE